MSTYILADNQDITREGLGALLRELTPTAKIVTAKNRSLLQIQLNTYPNAVVILDYTLFDFVSSQQMLNMKQGVKDSAWILFSEELGVHFLRQVMISDPTMSVVMKHDSKDNILIALQNATYHSVYICDYAEQILQSGFSFTNKPDKLTASEKIILHEIALGKTTKEIAWEKHLSFHTINSHRKNIFRKLEVNSIQEAIKYAIRAGLIDLTDYYI
ncbi:MAG: response regulator transcription factor [Tannerellaceae bacterium]|jgi:DNA-binding NarL/FixJ family response regulator|nr:response regulator transcription factor [Tannerellaceae bacterium]